MDSIILLERMSVLFIMVVIGIVSYRKGILDDQACGKITTLIVNILNPMIIISGVLGANIEEDTQITGNLFLVILMYILLIVLSYLYVRLRRFEKKQSRFYQLMMIFSNVGFIGIPLVKGIYGEKYIIYLVFYILVFNILAYTLGIYLASKSSDKEADYSWKNIFNMGFLACLISLAIFIFQIPVAEPIKDACKYMGDASIPLSMFIIGASVAKMSFRELFLNRQRYEFMIVKMLIIPFICVLIARQLPVAKEILGIFMLCVSMPCASIAGMLAQEYGGRGTEGNHLIAFTTVFSLVTVPVISLLL